MIEPPIPNEPNPIHWGIVENPTRETGEWRQIKQYEDNGYFVLIKVRESFILLPPTHSISVRKHCPSEPEIVGICQYKELF